MFEKFNSFHKEKNLNMLKFKKFTEGVFGRVESFLRKCWKPASSPFPKMFSKCSYLRVVKSPDCVVKSLGDTL